jgi:hypothetical protein
VGATHLTAREGSNLPPPQNLPQLVEISITIQHNSMGPTQQYGPWILLIYIYIKLPIDLDYKGEWGGGGPGHSWAQMARFAGAI